LHAWRTLESQLVYRSPVLEVKRCIKSHPRREAPHEFVTLHSSDWVNLVALTPREKMVLIRQYRQGCERVTLEIPGGMVDPGESPEQAAARELWEETGYQAQSLRFLGRVNPNPALFDNTCHTFLASGARRVSRQHLDETEDIEVLEMDPARVAELVRTGELDHSLVVAALCFFWLERGSLAP